MRAIRPQKPGEARELSLEEFPTPIPGPHQLLVRTEAVGVNYIDVYHRTGVYKSEPPIPLGLEGAGVVERLGAGVTDVREGTRVAWASAPGSYATHVVLDAARAVPIPDGVETRLAAALLLQGMTAHYLARSTFRLGPEHVALVHAAAGGVGLLLVQLAKLARARVIATVSTAEKAALARDAGADEVILYTEQDFLERTREYTSGRGVHVVYDSVGRATFAKSLEALAPRGYMVLYGQSSGPVEPFDPQRLAQRGSLFLTRPTLGHYTSTREELLERASELFRLVAEGRLRVRIDRELPLSDASTAHEALEGRETRGKVLLIP
ncbi:MAG: quinone oxidoreductase family protein [Myxococcota bacterium]